MTKMQNGGFSPVFDEKTFRFSYKNAPERGLRGSFCPYQSSFSLSRSIMAYQVEGMRQPVHAMGTRHRAKRSGQFCAPTGKVTVNLSPPSAGPP